MVAAGLRRLVLPISSSPLADVPVKQRITRLSATAVIDHEPTSPPPRHRHPDRLGHSGRHRLVADLQPAHGIVLRNPDGHGTDRRAFLADRPDRPAGHRCRLPGPLPADLFRIYLLSGCLPDRAA